MARITENQNEERAHSILGTRAGDDVIVPDEPSSQFDAHETRDAQNAYSGTHVLLQE